MMTLHHLVWALLNSIWQTAGLTLVVWALVKTVRSTAAQRYATWSAVLVAALILPFANFALAQLASPRQLHFSMQVSAPITQRQPAAIPHRPVFADAETDDTSHFTPTKVSPAAAPSRQLQTRSAQPLAVALKTWADRLLTGRFDPLILALWLLAVNLCLARLALGYARLSKVKKTLAYRVLSADEHAECAAVTRRPVAVGYSSDIAEPCVIGFAEPAIALPLDLALRFSKKDTERIIRHECAHIARWDDYGNLGKHIALAVLCFNPVVQAIARSLDLEREIACDDAAAFIQADRADFARCLCDIALMRADRGWLPTAGLGKNKSQLFVRIRQLLDGRHRHSTPLGTLSRIAVIGIVVTALPFALFQVIASNPATASAVTGFAAAHRTTASPTMPHFASTIVKVAPPAQTRPPAHPLALARTNVQVETVVTLPRVTLQASPMIIRATALRTMAVQQQRLLHLEIVEREPLMLQHLHQMVVGVVNEEHANGAGRDAFLDALHQAGFRNLSVDDVIAICNAGVTPKTLEDLHARGLTPMPAHDLIALANAGVDGAYLEGLKENGYANASIRDIIALRLAGVQPSYIGALAGAGYRDLSVRDLIRLSDAGVTPAFLAHLQQSGVTNSKLSVDDLIRLSNAGV